MKKLENPPFGRVFICQKPELAFLLEEKLQNLPTCLSADKPAGREIPTSALCTEGNADVDVDVEH